jgi:GNAT superfamily N-acetyltransferase
MPPASVDIGIRTHRPGDIGWVISQHGEVYAREYGWDIAFEAMVADLGAAFLRNYDSTCERCFIVARGEQRLGSAFVIRDDAQTAKLRMVILAPEARGLGLGKRLVAEAITFARAAGYARMTLWTNDVLHAARHIYVEAGFRLVQEEAHHSFGVDLVGQNWSLDFA